MSYSPVGLPMEIKVFEDTITMLEQTKKYVLMIMSIINYVPQAHV